MRPSKSLHSSSMTFPTHPRLETAQIHSLWKALLPSSTMISSSDGSITERKTSRSSWTCNRAPSAKRLLGSVRRWRRSPFRHPHTLPLSLQIMTTCCRSSPRPATSITSCSLRGLRCRSDAARFPHSAPTTFLTRTLVVAAGMGTSKRMRRREECYKTIASTHR